MAAKTNTQIKDPVNSYFLISGDESYLIRDKINDIKKSLGEAGINEFHQEKLSDQIENFPARLNQAVYTVSLMTGYKLIQVECEELFKSKNNYDEKIVDLLQDDLENITLVFIVRGKPDKRIKSFLEFKKAGKVIELSRPRYKDLDKWIVQRFRAEDKSVDGQLIKYLEYLFNNRLEALEQEIDKIITLNYQKDKISLKDTYEILSREGLLADNIIFNMLDNWVEGKKEKAIREYRSLIKDGQSPFYILVMIHRQLLLLLKVKELKENESLNPGQIARKIGEHPYPVKKCYRQTANFSFSTLEELLESLWQVNFDIVQGKGRDPEERLENFLLT
ncbi:MAG: DNA polymerase III subunit delta [Bacillota bacterium]